MTEPVRYRKDREGKRYRVVLNEGHEGFVTRWTESCTGCFEFNEGWGLEHYEYDAKHKCRIGAGCSECGYTGKRRASFWVPFDMTAWSRYVKAAEERQAAG